MAKLAQEVEDAVRASGVAEIPSDEVGLAILGPLRELDEVAYLRFASVYNSFTSAADFEPPSPSARPTGARINSPATPTCKRLERTTVTDIAHSPAPGKRAASYPGQGTRRRSGSTRPPECTPTTRSNWERRDVVMTNWRDGSINFEQRGVEFPDFWSVNAANIVTTKYFRGAVGTAQRESSLRQLIDRVVLTYTAAGRDNGYFASPEDVEIFEHELTWMLLHQVFSFNSPVWFNVGTSSPQQVSACQPYDALVSTPAGLIAIGKLVEQDAVGTKVYDAAGLTRIVATKANGIKDVLRLHTKAGHTPRCHS
ncbi:MAG: hypothetical protein WKF47_04440 [Geodermatophilaceae bacterium]